MITTEQINKTIDKFFHEHRAAWDEIVRIERIRDIQERKKQSLELFNTELLPHFKQEEQTLLSEKEFPQYSNDAERNQILEEHQQAYTIIQELNKGRNIEGNLSRSFPLMKSHIKLEDKYFSKVKASLAEELKNANNIEPIVLIILGLICLALFIWIVKHGN